MSVHERVHVCAYVYVVCMCIVYVRVCACVCICVMCRASDKHFKEVEHFIMLQFAFVRGYWKHQYYYGYTVCGSTWGKGPFHEIECYCSEE